MRALPVRVLSLLLRVFPCLLPAAPALAAAPLHFHLADSGAPPWLYLAPGGTQPEGVVADVLAATARQLHRELRYEFLPREHAGDAIRRGAADGALFQTTTRPPGRELVLTQPLAAVDSVLVTLKGKPVKFRLPSNLAEKKLCTLTEDLYPPLALLALKGTLRQTRAKTEQAQLIMLRSEDCVAAVVGGPMYRWMASHYNANDLYVEPKPLLRENLVLGFAARERDFADAVNRTLTVMRDSGRLDALVDRWLPEDARAGRRTTSR